MKTRPPTPTTAALAVVAALAFGAPAAAVAKPIAYSGKTSGGFEITFKRVGGAVKDVQALLPASCVPGGEGTPTAGDEIYAPPGRLALGREVRKSAVQEAAMHYDDVTKNYRFSASRRRNGTIAGRLHVNFSFQTVIFGADPRLLGWVCQGDGSFKAKPVGRPRAAASADRLLKGRFRTELEGVQRTTWAKDFHDTNGCDLTMKGSGTETVRFHSKPTVIGVLSYGPTISLSRGREAASLDLNAKITRRGTMETSGEVCSYGDGTGDSPPTPDCGTKRSRISVALDYVYKRRDLIAIRTDYAVPLGPFHVCPAGGISWPALFDTHPGSGREVAGRLPVRDLFRHGRNITIATDRAVQKDAYGSESVTTIRWSLSFTRIGKGAPRRARQAM